MKRFYYLATALLLFAGASSCKKNADVQEPEKQSSGRMIPFTVTAGQGAQKTSIGDALGTLVWDSGDQITVMKQDGTYPTTLTLKGDGGSASGEFDGEISEDVADGAELIGLYGVTYSGGTYSVTVPASQTYAEGSFQAGIFPSIGSGTYVKNGATQLTFSSNPLGILRVTVKGSADDKLTSVYITSYNSEKKLAGSFTLTEGSWAVSGGETYEIEMDCGDIQLSDEGVQVNFVVPTSTFASGELRVQAIVNKNGTGNYMYYTETNSSEIAITANNVTKIERTILLVKDVQNNWYHVCKIGSQYWMAENLYCTQFSSTLPSSDYTSDIIGATIETTEVFDVYTPSYIDGRIYQSGYLYNWAAAVGVTDGRQQTIAFTGKRQGICPDGWHIPDNDDWNALKYRIETTDGKGENTVGKYLKEEGTGSTWRKRPTTEYIDCYGFSARATGYYSGSAYIADYCYAPYWTPQSTSKTNATNKRLRYDSDNLLEVTTMPKYSACGVRCVKND